MADLAVRSQARHLLISLAMKRQKAGSGSERGFLLERTARLKFPDLTALLHGVNWAVIGAAATRLYMPERLTNDLDILIDIADSKAVRQRLTQSGATYRAELSIGGSSWTLADGFPLDVLEGRDEWIPAALAAAQTNRGLDGAPVLPLAYLVLMKFRASRVQDIADVSRMLGQAPENQLKEVRDVFTRFQADDAEDLESLILLGQLEMQ